MPVTPKMPARLKPRTTTKKSPVAAPAAAVAPKTAAPKTAASKAVRPTAPRKRAPAKPKTPFKSGMVAVIGRPNVGKSTLVNLLVQYKLSAVSPKPQTTRHKVLGVVTGENYQVALYDTPGMPSRATDEFDRRLLAAAMGAIQEADMALFLVEAHPPGDVEKRIMQELKKDERATILAINKVDQGRKEAMLPVIEIYNRLYPFLEIMPISALRKDGVDELVQLIVKHLPEGPPLFGADEITDRSERFLATEIVREQVFNAYAQEIPYAVAVEVEDFKESDEDHGGKDYVSAVLYVDKDSQKAILIGRGGLMLKTIGTTAREQIEKMLERPVHLELWVKVYPKWRRDTAFLERIGY